MYINFKNVGAEPVKIKAIIVLIILTPIILLTGCQAAKKFDLQIYTYPDVLLPVPQGVVLTREEVKPSEITLPKADISPLMRALRSAFDVPLHYDEFRDWESHRSFSLELDFNKDASLDVIVDGKVESLHTEKMLIDLKQRLVLIDYKGEKKVLAGANFSDAFITLLKEYNRELGFPLPSPGKGGSRIEQLPLAKPGQGKVQFLPPAVPRQSTGH